MTVLALGTASSSARNGVIAMAAGIALSACIGVGLTVSEARWTRHHLSDAEVALDAVRRHARIEYSHEELRGIVHRGARLAIVGQNQKLFSLKQADDYGNSIVKLADENAAEPLPPVIKAQVEDFARRAGIYVAAAKQATRQVFESPGDIPAVLDTFEKARSDFKPSRQHIAHVLADHHAASVSKARTRGFYYSIGIAASCAVAFGLSLLLIWRIRQLNILSP